MKKCINRRCNKELEDFHKFCPYCGKNQEETRRKEAKRPNGTGSIYVRKDNKSKPYAAASSVTGRQVYLGSFATRTEAVQALKAHEACPIVNYGITLEQAYAQWDASVCQKKSKVSQDGYRAAWLKLRPLYKRKLRDLRTTDLQAIIDYYDAPHHEEGDGGRLRYIDKNGKTTYDITATPKMSPGLKYASLTMIKTLLSQIYRYAMQNDYVVKDYSQFIDLPPKNASSKSRFTEQQLLQLRQAIGNVPYADYIYAMCYLNFRVSEFLELTADCYHISDSGIAVFVGGKKSEAGTDRIVPIHPNILPIVQDCLQKNGQTVFCDEQGAAMKADHFRYACFYPAIRKLGFPENLTPHSCRRTFSTRMSAAGARQEDIIALMGHTNFDIDINHYINQETDTLYNAIIRMA